LLLAWESQFRHPIGDHVVTRAREVVGVAERTSPTFRRRRLARRLRWMREQARMTLEEAAPRLDKTKSALSRIETGMAKADVHLVRSMMDVYDHYDPELLDLARAAARPGWWTEYIRPGPRNRGYVDIETEASKVFEVSLMYIPGLLQTESYTRTLFRNGVELRTEELIDRQVRLRMARQDRLTDEESSLELVAIIDEAALRKNVGGPAAMRDQLRHVVKCAALPTVTVQVLPDSLGTHLGMESAFIVLEFPEDDPDLLYIALITKSLHIDHAGEVAEAKELLSRLRAQALSPEESIAFIEQVIDTHWT
jgi:transcriptional regulator with XRE-family HTH domain